MEAKDYRIGNIVFDEENKPCKISLLTSEKRNKYEGEEPEIEVEYEESETIFISKVINPIPLNEEWLKKFGFEKNVTHKNLYHLIDQYHFRYNVRISRMDLIVGEISEFETSLLSTQIKHVHQLQNLFFALTGKELTL